MRTDEFDYPLPQELIAQHPIAQRDASRLLTLERASDAITHRRFADRYDGIGSLDDIRRASVLSGQFDEIWERADLDPNFRRLHI